MLEVQNCGFTNKYNTNMAFTGLNPKNAGRVVEEAADAFVNSGEKIKDKAVPFFKNLFGKLKPAMTKVAEFFGKVWNGVKFVWAKTKDLFNKLGEVFKSKHNKDTQMDIPFPVK